MDEAAAAVESEYLRAALAECAGNVTEATRCAGIDRKSFYRKLEQHGIDPATFRSDKSSTSG